MPLQYPIQLRFKLIALAPRIFVNDANGQSIFYVQQKALAFKEHIKIFTDESRTNQVYEIRADRIIDFSARYRFKDMQGNELGSIKHRGMRSIWKSYYDIYNQEGDTTPSYHLTEDNPWVKVIDAVAGQIPILSLLTGYFANPTYTMFHTATDTPVLKLKKQPAFFESTFTIEKVDERLTGVHELRLLLGILMAVQLERSRG